MHEPISVEWLLDNTKPNGECCEWQGQLFGTGYGSVFVAGRSRKLAHRLMATLVYGESKQDVLHSCNNPCCINPKHLSYGNDSRNMIDCRDTGAGIHTQKLTRDQAYCIKYEEVGNNVVVAERYGVHPTTVSNI